MRLLCFRESLSWTVIFRLGICFSVCILILPVISNLITEKKLRTSKSATFLTNQSLFYQLHKMLRSRYFYHWPKGKNPDNHFRFIIFVINNRNPIMLFIQLFCLFFIVGKMEQYPFQCLSLIYQFKYHSPLPFRFLGKFSFDGILTLFAAYNPPQIDGTAVSVRRTNQSEFIIFFRIFQAVRQNAHDQRIFSAVLQCNFQRILMFNGIQNQAKVVYICFICIIIPICVMVKHKNILRQEQWFYIWKIKNFIAEQTDARIMGNCLQPSFFQKCQWHRRLFLQRRLAIGCNQLPALFLNGGQNMQHAFSKSMFLNNMPHLRCFHRMIYGCFQYSCHCLVVCTI